MTKEQRGPERFGLGLALRVDGRPVGAIVDVSSDGIAFQAPWLVRVGTVIELSVEHPSPAGELLLRTRASVVRSERSGDGYTIGAKLLAPFAE